MLDPMVARLRAIEIRNEEQKRRYPSEAVLLACDLVLKYVKPHPSYTTMSQPPEME